MAAGGPKANMCILADGGFWPKLKPCDTLTNYMKWTYEGGKFVTDDGARCLRYDPSWSTSRLKVEPCDSTQDPIYSWNGYFVIGNNMCIGYDVWGDLYLVSCTSGSEQKYTLDTDGRIVSQGGHKSFQCVYADGWFWPKLRPCDNDAKQVWDFGGGKITTDNGQKCLKPYNGGTRLVVETCSNDNQEAIFSQTLIPPS